MVLLAVIPVVFAAAAAGLVDHHTLDWLTTWGSGIGFLIACVLCLEQSGGRRRDRRASFWFGIACGCWAGANLYYALVVAPDPIPLPSPADIGYGGFPLAVCAGLVQVARAERPRFSIDVSLDGLVAALGTAAVAAAVIFGLGDVTTSNFGAVITTLVYPLGDVAILGVLVGVWSVLGWPRDRYLAVIGVAVLSITAADVAIFSRVLSGSDVGGAFANLGWTAGVALLAASGLMRPTEVAQAEVLTARVRLVLPVVFTGVALAILALDAAIGLPEEAVVPAFGALAVSFARMSRAYRAVRDQEVRLRRSETQARTDAGRLRGVLDAITGYAIIGGSTTSGITFFSPGAEAMLGYTAAEVLGRSETEVFALEEEAARTTDEPGPARDAGPVGGLAAGRLVTRSQTYVDRNGARIPVVTTTTVLQDDGADSEYLSIARDVSEEHEAGRHRAVREAVITQLSAAGSTEDGLAQALRTIVDDLGWERAAIWLPGDDGLRCAQQWAEETCATRVSPDTELLDQVLRDARPRWIADATGAVIAVPVCGVAEGAPAAGVLELVGLPRPRSDVVLALLTTIGTSIGLHLERERGASQLRAARDEANAGSLAKSEFVSRISHELRTPLNAILGFAQLIATDGATPQQRDRIALIVSAARHLTDMIDDLLDLARVERGEMRITVEKVAATQVLKEVLDLTQPLIADRGLQLEVDVHDGLFRYVEADYQRLRQVLLNLVSNAVKYNRPGGSVRVDFEAEADVLRFLVTDTGPGIPDEQLAKLYRPFERLGAEFGHEEGTGLGLVVSKGLAEAMGGRLGVRTEVGVGSTFFVELRLTDTPPDRVLQTPKVLPDPARRRLPDATVLYIDDNPTNLALVGEILTREPAVRLLTAPLGAAGIQLAKQQRPDLVLLDLHLPDLDGQEVLRSLRSTSATSAIPVIVLSADGASAQRDRLLSAGAAAYLTKPVDVAQLLDTLSSVLRQPIASR